MESDISQRCLEIWLMFESALISFVTYPIRVKYVIRSELPKANSSWIDAKQFCLCSKLYLIRTFVFLKKVSYSNFLLSISYVLGVVNCFLSFNILWGCSVTYRGQFFQLQPAKQLNVLQNASCQGQCLLQIFEMFVLSCDLLVNLCPHSDSLGGTEDKARKHVDVISSLTIQKGFYWRVLNW